MRFTIIGLFITTTAAAADLESRALTHYLPQDTLETIVRKEGWTEIVLKPYGGIRKGDKLRVWAGGLIDHGGATAPGQNVIPPTGKPMPEKDMQQFSLSADPKQAFALLFKSDEDIPNACATAGRPLEVPLTKEGARVWIGYNDLKGRFNDNHLGRGRRHELDPLWVRVEVIRIVTD